MQLLRGMNEVMPMMASINIVKIEQNPYLKDQNHSYHVNAIRWTNRERSSGPNYQMNNNSYFTFQNYNEQCHVCLMFEFVALHNLSFNTFTSKAYRKSQDSPARHLQPSNRTI